MITIKYVDPNSNQEIEKILDESKINVDDYVKGLHKNYLCKNICNGENCKIWLKRNDEYILIGVED